MYSPQGQMYKSHKNDEYYHGKKYGHQGRRRSAGYSWNRFNQQSHHFQHNGTPYFMGPNRKENKSNEDQGFRKWKDRKFQQKEMGHDTQNGSKEKWFKITIPNGRKYEKKCLLSSIKRACCVPFLPVDFHYDKNRVQFFVQGAKIAFSLKDVSYKIYDESNKKIAIFISPSIIPYSVQNKFTGDQVEQIKVVMKKRYDVSHQALDLQKLRFDQDLSSYDIDMMLNRRSCMIITLQIIQEEFPEVLSLNLSNNKLYQLDGLSDIIERAPQVKILNLSKNKLGSKWELEKVKELKLEELWLEGNPFCDTFPDDSTYISAIRDYFPKLLRLDGKEIQAASEMDVETTPQLPQPYKETKVPESIKDLVLQFLQEYFTIYDNEDRRSLVRVYHDEAYFSLAIPFNASDPAQNGLEEYFKHNRDMKLLQDSDMRMKLLKHTKEDIVDSLSVLPKTQHDFYSFWVDMPFQTESMLCFSVNGLFREVEGKCQGHVRAFTRTFITCPKYNSSICIMNDELIVRNASRNQIQSAFIPLPVIPSDTVSSLSEQQQEMVKVFSMQSGLKLNWSQKCLDDNQWDYTKAAHVFSILQNEGKIPKDFFRIT